MSEAQVAQHQQRSRHENMSEAQVAQHQQRSRHESMTDSQVERQRHRHLASALSEEQIARRRASERFPTRKEKHRLTDHLRVSSRTYLLNNIEHEN